MERSRRSRTASAADVEVGQSPTPRAPQRMPPRQPNGGSWRSPRRLTRLLVVCGGLYMAAVLFWYSRRGSTSASSSVWPLTADEAADEPVAAPRSVRFRDGDAVYALDGKDPDETTAPEDELEDDDEQLHRIDLAEAMRNADHNLSPKEILAQLANLGAGETKPPAATVDEATIAAAEEHARHVKLLPMREKKTRRFRCVGWRSTGECSPFGPRTPAGDQSCSRTIPPGESGYCEIEDKDSGERFRVMQLHCDSLLPTARFRCFEAWDFANLHIQARDAFLPALKPGYVLENIAPQPADQQQTDGIIMVVYPKLVPSAYATIRALRAMGCSLPVEIWFRPDEIRSFPPALQLLNASFGPVTFRAIDYTRAVGFATKIHALMHSQFERVLFLDADNVPVRDPTYLFSTREFVETGAIFWPDFWHPGHSIFNVHAKSPLWELLDMPFVNMFEQESGQLLIDRRRHAAPLELVQFFTYHRPNHFERLKLVYGDKDLFRLAWLKTEHAFHMIQTPPSIAGKVVNGSLFCGMTMAQHDPAGDVLFLHRNSRKLLGAKEERPSKRMALTRRERKELRRQILARRGIVVPKSADLDDPDDEDGEDDKVEEDKEDEDPLEADGLPDPIMWTHLFSFKRGASRKHYVVGIYKVLPFLPESQSCYGEARAFESNYFTLTAFADMPFASLENELRAFAHEAAQLDANGKR